MWNTKPSSKICEFKSKEQVFSYKKELIKTHIGS